MVNSVEERIQRFITSLRRGNVSNSFSIAVETAEIAREVISSSKSTNATEIIDKMRDLGKRLVKVAPVQLCLGNVLLRIMRLIREEYVLHAKSLTVEPGVTTEEHKLERSSSGMFQTLSSTVESDYTKPYNVRRMVLAALTELIDEIKGLYHDIANQALEHIHANEVIMTYGLSKTVEEFLKAAAQIRKFEVFMPEGAPTFSGQKHAQILSNAGLNVTVIPDSAIFAIMARVNKVIIGTHAVMANGGLIAQCGAQLIAQAAKYHSVPVVVAVGMYKLCPLYPTGPQTFNILHSPSAVLNFEEADICPSSEVDVLNPAFDYVQPELVSLFVTNYQLADSGGHSPSYIYRLLVELYSPEDYDIFDPIDSMK